MSPFMGSGKQIPGNFLKGISGAREWLETEYSTSKTKKNIANSSTSQAKNLELGTHLQLSRPLTSMTNKNNIQYQSSRL